jgi:hypothetical protein
MSRNLAKSRVGDMTVEEWRRIKAVAADAWKQPAGERAAYAATACGDDQALHTEVSLLLKSMTEAAELYESPGVILRGEPEPME